MTLTIHMIANAHLDPVWLWSWQRGADEVVATCRVACDLLNEYLELIYTRDEAWVYEIVHRCAPDVFERIKHHIANAHWECRQRKFWLVQFSHAFNSLIA